MTILYFTCEYVIYLIASRLSGLGVAHEAARGRRPLPVTAGLPIYLGLSSPLLAIRSQLRPSQLLFPQLRCMGMGKFFLIIMNLVRISTGTEDPGESEN